MNRIFHGWKVKDGVKIIPNDFADGNYLKAIFEAYDEDTTDFYEYWVMEEKGKLRQQIMSANVHLATLPESWESRQKQQKSFNSYLFVYAPERFDYLSAKNYLEPALITVEPFSSFNQKLELESIVPYDEKPNYLVMAGVNVLKSKYKAMKKPEHFRLDFDTLHEGLEEEGDTLFPYLGTQRKGELNTYRDILKKEGETEFCSVIQTDLEAERDRIQKEIAKIKALFAVVPQSKQQVNYANFHANNTLFGWQVQEHWLNTLIGFFCNGSEVYFNTCDVHEALAEFSEKITNNFSFVDGTEILSIKGRNNDMDIRAKWYFDEDYTKESSFTYIGLTNKSKFQGYFESAYVSNNPLQLCKKLRHEEIGQTTILIIDETRKKRFFVTKSVNIMDDAEFWDETWDWLMDEAEIIYGGALPYAKYDEVKLKTLERKAMVKKVTPSVKKALEVELAKLKLENAKPTLYNAFEKGFFGKKFKTKGKVAKDGTVGILIQFNYFLRFLQDYLAEITMKALNKNKQLKFEPKIFSIIIYAFMKAFQTGRFNSHIEITVGKMDESEILQLLCELYEENLKTDTHIADYLNNKFKNDEV